MGLNCVYLHAASKRELKTSICFSQLQQLNMAVLSQRMCKWQTKNNALAKITH